jgi:hypothetical protein
MIAAISCFDFREIVLGELIAAAGSGGDTHW